MYFKVYSYRSVYRQWYSCTKLVSGNRYSSTFFIPGIGAVDQSIFEYVLNLAWNLVQLYGRANPRPRVRRILRRERLPRYHGTAFTTVLQLCEVMRDRAAHPQRARRFPSFLADNRLAYICMSLGDS
jgi:hypothetical protein